MSAVAVAKPQPSQRENEKKWTKTLMDAGWTAIPSVILERQKAFGLDAIDVNILLHLASHWWYASELPFPGKRSIAESMNISPRTVQRHLAKMEFAGFIQRLERTHETRGRLTNKYDFSGLIKEATPYAQEIIEARRKAREEKQKRRSRLRAQPPPPTMKLAE